MSNADDLKAEAEYADMMTTADKDRITELETALANLLDIDRRSGWHGSQADEAARLLGREVHPAHKSIRDLCQTLAGALDRQGDNMAFVLNHMDVKNFYRKFTGELAEDRAALTAAKAMGIEP